MSNLTNFSDRLFNNDEVYQELKRVDAKGEFDFKSTFATLPEASRVRCPQTYKELDERSRFRIVSTSPNLDTRITTNSCV
jgi:hypothetical protein